MTIGSGYTYSRAGAPFAVRLFNVFAPGLKPPSNRFLSLDCRDILDSASRKTKLNNWGDPGFKTALEAMLKAVDREGNLTFFGRFAFRQFVLGNMINRLRVVEAVERFPEIRAQTIRQPIFIMGCYRTGTTFLHNLLSTHPQLRAPLYWELRHPCPANDPRTIHPAKLIRLVKLTSRIHRYLAPEFTVAHTMSAEKPEECLHLFENAGAGTTAFFITEAKEFAWWLLEHHVQHAYEFYQIQLKLLNWLRPGHRWLLKWPYHLWHLGTLLETFPDATVIHIHRCPCEAIASVCSLAALARAPFCERIDAEALGRFWLDYSETGLKRALAVREKIRGQPIIDVMYAELISDPLPLVQRIMTAAGLQP